MPSVTSRPDLAACRLTCQRSGMRVAIRSSTTIGTVKGLLVIGGLCAAESAISAPSPTSMTTQRATTHAMRYHLALPTGWTRDRTWPVVVVIPDAGREFEANLQVFVTARGDRPYILVAPEVLSCGGARSRTAEHYSYAPAEWDSISRGDDFAFDDPGLAAVLSDVRERWGGEPKAFLTGWEAGGHTVWEQTLRRPERWRAVAPVTTNYQRRGLTSTTISTAPARGTLPIRVFRCGASTGAVVASMRFFDQQTAQAFADARAHGFAPQPVRVVPGADHGPLAEPVLAWFDSLRRR